MSAATQPGPAGPSSADLAARLLYRDGLMLVLDKPAGLPVHPGPGGGPTVADQLDELRFGLPARPEIAHRLDKGTSGCLVLGRHRKALARLGRLFASGAVDKVYWAVVDGGPPAASGTIDWPIARRSRTRGWWMRVDPAGDPATTHYRILAEGGGRCWLELRPVTGRTHQLRVHLAALGCPIEGDAVYGDAPRGAALHLHARSVRIPLYPKRAPIEVTAPAPEHLLRAVDSITDREP
ncbi:MAG: RNA pseudouridine synthase [Geminicoccaceae bacterium]|nr:RNA pseudouridine synthase [Geminicoccaceae bacterium]